MRYGLGAPGGRTMTLSDISAAYGVTTERIRQIEDSGLRRLREPDRAAGVARVTAMLAECE
jgi:DNA-directed RNA polymerase sigma subunit (sigma70/sigma32)